MRFWLTLLLLSILVAASGASGFTNQTRTHSMSRSKSEKHDSSSLPAKIKRFAPTEVKADTSHLTPGDRQALAKIVEAAKLMDPVFLRQAWSGNAALLKKLRADSSPAGRERLHYFLINVGPWSRLDKNEPFIDGVPAEKPAHAGFYPDDMTKDEFNSWIAGLSEEDKKRATGFFYVIRRDANRKLKIVPYSEEYREFLAPAARLLNEAAALTKNATLKSFLTKRAAAFSSNDYYESDVAWMDLDSPIELTIGPYETYEDELFGYKAGFEVYVTLRDEAESSKLAKFGAYLQEVENNLPIDPKYRNSKLGAASPIRVVDEVFAGGEGNAGVQTAAYNLPNDDRVIREKGSKRVMLKNVQEAKFNKALIPISRVVLDKGQQADISFDAFFTHILAHELMHGLGPHGIKVGGRDTTVRQELKDLYSAIEEAKADVAGLFALQYLIDKGAVDKKLESSLYTTYLASAFRSVRFGITEAHGKAVALLFNYVMDDGGFAYDEKTATFRVVPSRIKESVRKLTHDIMTLQAEGSYEKARAMLARWAEIRPAMKKAFDILGSVPVDIEPVFTGSSVWRTSLR
ncbi:MAG: hypothetical protein DMF61_07415 [Blastocatellia bacterium AA13]|nr:MAG: hypothetical protein DMF61_07415 [Blastocatellia bacterium AA13]